MTYALTPWVIQLRDSAIAVAAVAGALVTIIAAARLPLVSRPTMWLWRQLTEDGVATYWERHRQVAAEAVEPRMLAVAERLGEIGAIQAAQGDEIHDLRERVERIEATCTAIRTTEVGIATSTAAIAGTLNAARRRTDPTSPFNQGDTS